MHRTSFLPVVLLSFLVLSSSVFSSVYAKPTQLSHYISRFTDSLVIAVTDVTGSPIDQARVRLDMAEHLSQEIEDLSTPSEENIEENEQYANDVVNTLDEIDDLIDEACERDCSQETLRHRERTRIQTENATRKAVEAVERNIERYRGNHPDEEVPQGLLQAGEQLRTAHRRQQRQRQEEQGQQQNGQGGDGGNGQGGGEGNGQGNAGQRARFLIKTGIV